MNRTFPETPTRHLVTQRRWIYAAAAGLLLSIILLPWLSKHLFSPNIWFDESGQYWLALGLHHFTPPLSPPSGWDKIVEYGRHMNSDPGNYTLILRGWISVFGSDIATLRTFSLLFFLLGPILIWLSARRLEVPASAAALAALAPCGFAILLHYATEIRAYSMEAFSVWYFFFLAAWTQREERTSRLLLLGMIGAVLVGSRYSAYLYAGAACLVLLATGKPANILLKRCLFVGAPITIFVALGFMIFGRYQAGGSHRAPAYVEPFMLQGKDADFIVQQLKQNSLAIEAWPITGFLLLVPIWLLVTKTESTSFRQFAVRAWLFVVISLVFVIGASVAGRLPWAIHTRWSIGYQALSAACLATLIMMLAESWRTFAPLRLHKPIGAVAFVLALAFWGWHTHHVQAKPRFYYESAGVMLEQLARQHDKAKLRFWVTAYAGPSVRYLCEAGPLKGQFTYPANFHFETAEELKASAPISTKSIDVIVLHDQSILPAYESRIATLDNTRPPTNITLPPGSALIITKGKERAAGAP